METSLTFGNSIKIDSFSNHTPEVRPSSIAPFKLLGLINTHFPGARERHRNEWSNYREASAVTYFI